MSNITFYPNKEMYLQFYEAYFPNVEYGLGIDVSFECDRISSIDILEADESKMIDQDKSMIQERWEQSEVVGLDVITYANGDVVNIEITVSKDLKNEYTYQKNYVFDYLDKTNLPTLLKEYKGDVWVGVDVFGRLEVEDYVIVCGDGGMGNEGYIARLDLENRLVWSLFSTVSNPFMKIVLDGDFIYVQSSHNFWMVINKIDNTQISIINHSPK